MGLALQVKDVVDVASHGRAVLEEVLVLSAMEWARCRLERLLEVLGSLASPLALRTGGAFGCNHHLLSRALLVAMAVGHDGFIIVVPTVKVSAVLALAAEVGQDSFLSYGVLSGVVQKVQHHSWGLMPECMDKRLVGGATGEGIDDVGISHVGELVPLL